ncbi:MAG TPA: hypothetical protein VLT47_08730 [Anaeromyxobacteraceae bacterium]|nr:hypothetical protein [Anaeromyxobacteraceae bacterium]
MSLTITPQPRLLEYALDPQESTPAPVDRGRRGRASGAGRSAAPEAVTSRSAADPLTLSGLAACVEEARATALSRKGPPPDPVSFASLRERVGAAVAKLPPAYRRAVGEPLVALLDRLGAAGYARVLAQDPGREGTAGLLLDVVQAVLQRAEGYGARATDAFQEVVSDLYEGFVAAEGRTGVKPPDAGTLPPLVRWGSPESGPYTWPATATAALGVKAGVVSLPAANAQGGLLAWPALAHETAGHDILEADEGLSRELAAAVSERLKGERLDPAIASYWSSRIDEVAADVLGVLNMGPAAAVGLVGYFRALNGAWKGTAALRNVGRADDPHPADIARAYLAAETVRLLSFEGAARWADRLTSEIDRDLGRVWFGGLQVTSGVAKASAAAVARAIVQTRLASLEGHALGEIQGWTDRDEAIVASLRQGLDGKGTKAGAASSPGRYAEGAYAAHAVAAGIYEAVSGRSQPAEVTRGLVAMLDAMHDRNPAAKASPAARVRSTWEPRPAVA